MLPSWWTYLKRQNLMFTWVKIRSVNINTRKSFSFLDCEVPSSVFQYLYRASFTILYYDQQMHNYFTIYHTSFVCHIRWFWCWSFFGPSCLFFYVFFLNQMAAFVFSFSVTLAWCICSCCRFLSAGPLLFEYMYRASFMVLYYDQQMHNYFTN